MDPSNFGSFSSGGNFGGTGATGTQNGGVASGTGTIASPQQSAPVQAQGFVGVQAAQPQMQQSGQVGAISGGARSQMIGLQMAQPQIVQPQMAAQSQASGSMQFQPQVVSSSTEDVVLGGAGPKKSKKGVVVGVVIAVLVLVGVGVGAMLLSRKNTAVELLKSEDTFNTYANYLLFGNATDVAVDANLDDVRETVYALDCEDKTHSECKEFFEEAKILLDNFRSSDYKGSLSEEYILEVEDYILLFDEYYSYIVFDVMDDDAVLARYMEDGYDGTIEYIEKYYNDLVNSDDAFLANYGGYEIERTKVIVDNIKELEQAGCIVNGQNDRACMENFKYSEETIERIMDFEYGVGNDVRVSINGVRDDLAYETIFTADLLSGNGGGGDEEN